MGFPADNSERSYPESVSTYAMSEALRKRKIDDVISEDLLTPKLHAEALIAV